MVKHRHRLSIRLSDNEYKKLSLWAKISDSSRGKFIRLLIKIYDKISYPPFAKSFDKYIESYYKGTKINDYMALNKLDAIYPILYRTSNNLNQIARAEHTKGYSEINPGTLSDLKKSLDKTYSIVKEVLK